MKTGRYGGRGWGMSGMRSSSGDLGEKDCLWRDGSLPAWWLFLSSRAFNGKAVPLGVWLEGMPHFSLINVSLLQISTISRGQINWVSFWEQRNEYWLGVYRLIFNWWFHLGPSNWSFSDLSAACPHIRCVRSSLRVCARRCLAALWVFICEAAHLHSVWKVSLI